MTTAPVAVEAPRALPRAMLIALAVPATLYLLLHYVVMTWTTADLVSRATVLSGRMFSVAGVEVRLWWLITALNIVLALCAHMVCLHTDFGITLSVAAHLPAIIGTWVMVWSGFTTDPARGIGTFVGNLFWCALFALLIAGSAIAIGAVLFSAGEKYL